MDGENMLIHSNSSCAGKIFDLYSKMLELDEGSLKIYKEIAENPNVPDELRSEALKICEECERNKQETKKLVVNATIAISAMVIFAAVMTGRRY